MGKFDWAPAAFRRLNGVFCVYKPLNMSEKKATKIIRERLLKELNAMPCYSQEMKIPMFSGVKNDDVTSPISLNLPVEPSKLLEHRLVLGQRYIEEDIKLRFIHSIGYRGSGVLVMGIGKGLRENMALLSLAKFLRVYHVKGRFGYATQNFFPDGHFIERTTFRHITKGKLDKVCGSAQSGHQKLIFQYAGVNPNSQEAYELASQGMVRPKSSKTPPILYGVKCIDLNLPDFTLEVHSINESEEYLGNLVNDIALSLKSTAVCTHIHRLRYGNFTTDHAILQRDWTIDGILNNIRYCQPLMKPNKLLTDVMLSPDGQMTSTGQDKNRELPSTAELVKAVQARDSDT